MISVIYVFLMLFVFFIFKSDNKSREELRKKCKELYNKNIDLELEIDKLKINPFYGHSKFLGFTLEELKELKHFCDCKGWITHDFIRRFEAQGHRIKEQYDRIKDADKIILAISKSKYAPKKSVSAYIKKWGVK